MARLGDWLRAHPLVVDLAIALGVLAFTLPSLFLYRDIITVPVHEPDALGVLLVLAASVPLVWRRRSPLLVTVVVAVPATILYAMSYPTDTTVSTLIGVYTTAAYADRRRAWVALGVAALSILVPLPFEDMPFSGATTVALGGLLVACYAFGRSIAFRRAYTAELESRATRLEQARDADLRAVVAEERTRIARELHDVVAHHVSVMTVQASAARRTLARDPVRTAEALAAIESTGRSALEEMRQIVGVLRASGEDEGAGELAPQPGVDDLADLVEHVRDAGLDVALVSEGMPRPLPQGVGLSVYRASCPGSAHEHAQARWPDVGAGHAALRRERAVGVGPRPRSRRGSCPRRRPRRGRRTDRPRLPGMRERVALYGGQLRVGARSGGGFEVSVRLPIPPVSRSDATFRGGAPGVIPA
ncbi:MAG: histidine kinase [Actinomycetota bacterium]|nr:histidine kinase [Actinomycetota bacterium]